MLGPVPAEEGQERMLVRVPRGRAAGGARRCTRRPGVRSARKAADPVRIQVDPGPVLSPFTLANRFARRCTPRGQR